MRFTFTDEQNQLRDTIRRFLDEVSSPADVRQCMESKVGFDRVVWERLHQELGIGGVLTSSSYGGADLSFIELAIVLEEMGRALYCSPYLSTSVFAATVIDLLGTEEQKGRLLPEIGSGKHLATLAQYEDGRTFDPKNIKAKVKDGVLNGHKTLVTDGHVADSLLVLAHDANDQPCYFIVDSKDTSVAKRMLDAVDWTRKLSEIHFDDAKAELVGDSPPSQSALDYIFNLQIAALANEMVGGASRMLDAAVSYSKERVQFGRTIGSLQAIKHKCADLLLEVEFAKSAAYRAAQAIADNDPNLNRYCSLAKAVANDAYLKAASDCIQVHGGIGFTWENDTHLWFKRAKSSEVYLGNTQFHRERYLSAMAL